MEDGMSRSDFLNEDGHGGRRHNEISFASVSIDKANLWIEQSIAMLEESSKHADLNKKITDDERAQVREVLHEVFAYETIKENQKIVDGD